MAPNGTADDPIDLDDEPDTSQTGSRPQSQRVPSSSTRKKPKFHPLRTSSASPNKSRNGVTTIDLSSPPPKQSDSGSKRKHHRFSGTSYLKDRQATTQDSQTGRSSQVNGHSSNSKTSNGHSAPREVIDLDSDEPPKRPGFITPREYEPESAKGSSASQNGVPSSFAEEVFSLKRKREDEPLYKASPEAKKMKWIGKDDMITGTGRFHDLPRASPELKRSLNRLGTTVNGHAEMNGRHSDTAEEVDATLLSKEVERGSFVNGGRREPASVTEEVSPSSQLDATSPDLLAFKPPDKHRLNYLLGEPRPVGRMPSNVGREGITGASSKARVAFRESSNQSRSRSREAAMSVEGAPQDGRLDATRHSTSPMVNDTGTQKFISLAVRKSFSARYYIERSPDGGHEDLLPDESRWSRPSALSPSHNIENLDEGQAHDGVQVAEQTDDAATPSSASRLKKKITTSGSYSSPAVGDQADVVKETPTARSMREVSPLDRVSTPSQRAVKPSSAVKEKSAPEQRLNGAQSDTVQESVRIAKKVAALLEKEGVVADDNPSKHDVSSSGESPSVSASSSRSELIHSRADTDNTSPGNGSGRQTKFARQNIAVTRDIDDTSDAADLQLRSEAMQSVENAEAAAESESAFARPTMAASAARARSLYSHLPLAKRVEKILGQYLEELREDNEHNTGLLMKRARLSREEAADTAGSRAFEGERTSFTHLQPLKLTPHLKSSPSSKTAQAWTHQKMLPDGKGKTCTYTTSTSSPITTDAQDVPNYNHYVRITGNLLAPNVTNLHCWPYFGDDFNMKDAYNLKEQYNMDISERGRKLLLLSRAEQFEEYADNALRDLECSWADVLRFLLEEKPDVGEEPTAQGALRNRQQYCNEDFSRSSARWTAVLTSLPPSTPEKLALVALLCENFQKMAKFSLWHIARRSELARLPSRSVEPGEALSAADNKLTCRICLRFDCPYHGEYEEREDGSDSEEESASSVDEVVACDIVHPYNANHRRRIEFPSAQPSASESSEARRVPSHRKEVKYWYSDRTSFQHKPDERGPFYPCDHPGSTCSDAQCSCFLNHIPCEKICSCAHDCSRKFQGCSCSTEKVKKGQKMVCFEDERCACFQVGRECDPDLCGTCGVCEVVDPVNKYNERILSGRCRNANIQRGVPKHTILGDSGVHGLGLYACEDIRVHEFVGEYKGEIITNKEADRRGAVYEHQKLSYLFNLNKDQEIDSTYFGNKTRFINHAPNGKANLYPRIIMVNMVHRIALYAERAINSGRELLFDYGPKFPDEQLGGKKSDKAERSAPHVRNANLVKGFLDVEESEDEVGNVRAKGVTKGTKPKTRRKKGKAPVRPEPTLRRERERETHHPHLEDSDIPQNTEPETSDPKSDDISRLGPEERLARFNISEDDPMDVDATSGAEDDDFEPDFRSGETDESDSGRSYESEVEDDDEDEAEDLGRYGATTRSTRRA